MWGQEKEVWRKEYRLRKVTGRQGELAKHFHSFLLRMRAKQTKYGPHFFSLNQTLVWLPYYKEIYQPFFIFTSSFSSAQDIGKEKQTTEPFCPMILTLELLKNVLIFLCQKLYWNWRVKKLNFVNRVRKRRTLVPGKNLQWLHSMRVELAASTSSLGSPRVAWRIDVA